MTAQEIYTSKVVRNGGHSTVIGASSLHGIGVPGKKGTFSIAQPVKYKA
jgi:hypothetical protein